MTTKAKSIDTEMEKARQAVMDVFNDSAAMGGNERAMEASLDALIATAKSEAPAPDENGLLPCPFCGGAAKLVYQGEYWVRCTAISVCFGHVLPGPIEGIAGFRYERDAIECWNRRK